MLANASEYKVQVGLGVQAVASIAKWRKSFSDIWRKPLAAGVM
jgi:hypothetical protein